MIAYQHPNGVVYKGPLLDRAQQTQENHVLTKLLIEQYFGLYYAIFFFVSLERTTTADDSPALSTKETTIN